MEVGAVLKLVDPTRLVKRVCPALVYVVGLRLEDEDGSIDAFEGYKLLSAK